LVDFYHAITDIPGIKVGHAEDIDALTGCTVVLCEKGAVGGVDQRGGAPGTRETDLLRPMHQVNTVHAVLLAGGSAFGLDAAGGVMRHLREKKIGVNTGIARVPIVPAAILFDLGIGRADVFPDADMGYQACQNAVSGAIRVGSVGAGTGATVGKTLGMGQAMRSGIGTASMEIGGGVRIGALIAVNCFGDVIDPATHKIIAGARPVKKGPLTIGESGKFANTMSVFKTMVGRTIMGFASGQNTVIGVVATNARLTKEEANKVAQTAHNGLAMTIRPAHTMLDGDTIFALATGEKKVDVNIVAAFAPLVVAEAILSAVRSADHSDAFPAAPGYSEADGS
jgi:L-aminopeptidase/D-esterase-like protein